MPRNVPATREPARARRLHRKIARSIPLSFEEICMNNILRSTIAIAIAVSAAGCATWDNLSDAQKGTAIGAGVGGVAGAAATGGGVLGTVGGAAVGGVVGHEIGKRRDRE
jgi:osmotically inducible lipoprotein OsmB